MSPEEEDERERVRDVAETARWCGLTTRLEERMKARPELAGMMGSVLLLNGEFYVSLNGKAADAPAMLEAVAADVRAILQELSDHGR